LKDARLYHAYSTVVFNKCTVLLDNSSTEASVAETLYAGQLRRPRDGSYTHKRPWSNSGVLWRIAYQFTEIYTVSLFPHLRTVTTHVVHSPYTILAIPTSNQGWCSLPARPLRRSVDLGFRDQCRCPAGIHAGRLVWVRATLNQQPIIHLAIGCDRPGFRLVTNLVPSHLGGRDCRGTGTDSSDVRMIHIKACSSRAIFEPLMLGVVTLPLCLTDPLLLAMQVVTLPPSG
jgi:hypothetical protein